MGGRAVEHMRGRRSGSGHQGGMAGVGGWAQGGARQPWRVEERRAELGRRAEEEEEGRGSRGAHRKMSDQRAGERRQGRES
jgi:hypothetical protein